MPEKPDYSGLYKEGFVYKDGNLKGSPEYNRFSDIIQKIDQNQRLLYMEWDGSFFFLGVQFHCSSVTINDGRPVRDSRRMYFEQVPYGASDPSSLTLVLQQFYVRAEKKIKSFYSERYDNIQMRLATSVDFTDYISGYYPKPPQSFVYKGTATAQYGDTGLSKYFGGKILLNERCSVLSSDFIKAIKMIADLFEVLKRDKKKIICIISELDNPNDPKLVCDFLIRIAIKSPDRIQNIQSFTYDADTHTFSESSFTQGLYRSLYNYLAENRHVVQKEPDFNALINNFVQSFTSSNESAKMQIDELCNSKLGKRIAKVLIIRKLQNGETIDSDHLKIVYTSQTGADLVDFGKILLNHNYDFPELYSDVIKKLIYDGDFNFLSYIISKDFPEYQNFQTNIVNTFKKFPWDNPKFCSNAKKILGWIFSNYSPEKVEVGGKLFTRLLYQSLRDHEEIDKVFVQKYSEKMRSFEIDIPIFPDKSLFKNTKFRGYIIAGILIVILAVLCAIIVYPVIFQAPVNTGISSPPVQITKTTFNITKSGELITLAFQNGPPLDQNRFIVMVNEKQVAVGNISLDKKGTYPWSAGKLLVINNTGLAPARNVKLYVLADSEQFQQASGNVTPGVTPSVTSAT